MMPAPLDPSVSLPAVDLAPVTSGTGDATARRAVADLVGATVAEHGFFTVTGHGIPRDVLNDAYDAAAALVSAPARVTGGLTSPTGHPYRGWQEERDEQGTPLLQRFEVCTVDDASHAATLGINEAWHGYFHPNVWPARHHGLDGFEPAVRRWAAASRALGDTLMELFALTLGLPASHFAVAPGRDVSCFAVNHYPGKVGGGTVTFDEHTDSGTLTLLHQRGGHAGLEVVHRSGARKLVPVEEEAVVVNIGELMTRWTNGRWQATRHRVVAPAAAGTTRTSLVTFHLPEVDTVVAPLPSLVGAGDEPAFEPVAIHDWEGTFLADRYASIATGAD